MAAKTYLWYHLVFTTKYRRPLLSALVVPHVRACLAFIAELRGGSMLAFSDGPDRAHVHVLITLPPDVALASYVRDAKSMSARHANTRLGRSGSPFWGARYFARTVGSGSLQAAREYVKNQWKHDA